MAKFTATVQLIKEPDPQVYRKAFMVGLIQSSIMEFLGLSFNAILTSDQQEILEHVVLTTVFNKLLDDSVCQIYSEVRVNYETNESKAKEIFSFGKDTSYNPSVTMTDKIYLHRGELVNAQEIGKFLRGVKAKITTIEIVSFANRV